MSKSTELLKKVFEYLNSNANYAVLRNFEGLPSNNESRDIDIVITKPDLKKHQTAILDLFTSSGWEIVNYLNNGRLITYVCGIIDNNNVELIQWDFFLHTSVHGITLIEAEELLRDREFNGFLYHVSKPYEFLDKYVYNRSVGVPYPKKYQAIRAKVEQDDKVKLKLENIFGTDNLTVIDAMSSVHLLKKALLQNLKNQFFTTMGRIFIAQWLHISSYLSSRVAVSLGITGLDEEDRNNVITVLQKEISSVFGKATDNYNFRPNLIPEFRDAAYSSELKNKKHKFSLKPDYGKKNSFINSVVHLCCYTADYIAGFWIRIKPNCRLTKFIIFDRYYTDIIINSSSYNINVSSKFLYYWGKLIIPSLQYNILLTAETKFSSTKKNELGHEEENRISNNLKYLAEKDRHYLIVNNGDPAFTALEILTIIFKVQNDKNLKLMW